jgi:putative inorganic carbon (hco3(-)) transporter
MLLASLSECKVQSLFRGSFIWGGFQNIALIETSLQSWWESSLAGRLQAKLRPWAGGSTISKAIVPIALVLLMALLIISPFVPTEVVGGLLLLAAVSTMLLFCLKERAYVPLALPVSAFWQSAFIALLGSPKFGLSLDGWVKITLYLLVFALAVHLFADPRARTVALTTYLTTTLPVTLFGLYQWRTGAAALATWVDPESSLADTTRIYSFLGNPNLLAGYLIAAVPLGIVGFLVWKPWGAKFVGGLASLMAAICIVLTFSRGGWIALVVTSLLFGFLLLQWFSERFSPQLRIWIPIGLVAGSFILLGLVVLAVPILRERASSIFTGRGDSSNNFRINVWAAVFDMIRAFPLTGIGPGNRTFEAIYPFFQRPKFNALSAYSIPLEITVEMGIPGLLTFIWLVFATTLQGLVTWTRRLTTDESALWSAAATCAILGLLVDGFTDTVWFRPPVQLVWWLLCAVIASEFLRWQQTKKPPTISSP